MRRTDPPPPNPLVEHGVIGPRISGGHRALDEDDLLGLPHPDHRHAYTQAGSSGGGGAGQQGSARQASVIAMKRVSGLPDIPH